MEKQLIKSFTSTPDINIQGTFGVGKLDGITYQELVKTFGPPTHNSNDDKVQVEWVISFINRFDDKVIATIYDWKSYGMVPESINYWNVGGKKNEALWLVKEALHTAMTKKK
ncbi:hypothetical protein OAA15_00710 [bacterium]|nr:hypothetical protein [bacterium]